MTPEEEKEIELEAHALSKKISALFLGATPSFPVAAAALGRFLAVTTFGVKKTKGSKAAKEFVEMFYQTLAKASQQFGMSVSVQLITPEAQAPPTPPKEDDDDELIRRLRR